MHLLKEMTILYVEDDADVLQALAASLQRWSKKLFTAADGREGWELYRRHQGEIDLVLTDIKMPVMDGIALIKAIRKEDEEIPVLITSAHGESHYLYEAIEEGVNGYLLKPLSIKRLKRVLQSVSKSLCYDTLRHDYLNLLRKGVEKTDTPTLLVEDARQPRSAASCRRIGSGGAG